MTLTELEKAKKKAEKARKRYEASLIAKGEKQERAKKSRRKKRRRGSKKVVRRVWRKLV